VVFEMVLDYGQESVQLSPRLRFFRPTEPLRPDLHGSCFLLARKVRFLSNEIAEPERADRIR
jgi:hypothetical protein